MLANMLKSLIENGRPTVQRHANLRLVVGEAGRAPEIRYAVRIAGVERRVAELRCDVAEIRQFAMIQRDQSPLLDQDAHHVIGRHHDVIVARTRRQLFHHRLVRVIDIELHLDARLRRELIKQFLRDV